MTKRPTTPTRFHKYRAFDSRTVESLVCDSLFFADPSTFNDPLDTRPSLEANLSSGELENVFTSLVQRRISGEMSGAAKVAKFKDPTTNDHIDRHAKAEAARLLEEVHYNAGNPQYDEPEGDVFHWLIASEIEDELLRQNDRGIFSLSERYASSLMWSHYGDQHRGLCIGYSVPKEAKQEFHKVNYSGGRLVKASDVAAMLAGDDHARRTVDDAVLLRKAPDWRYEREWRLIGPRGLHDSPLELETVTFGMRCSSAVQHTVVAALVGRLRGVRFYEMYEIAGSFQLKRRALELDELKAHYPVRSRNYLEHFAALDLLE